MLAHLPVSYTHLDVYKRQLGGLLRESVAPAAVGERVVARVGPPARRVGVSVAAALADAAAILEGENGLLFLLALLLLLFWIGR